MKSFTIPKPCHENWENMLPEEKGRFCGACKKKVYDFTQKSPQEIQDIFDKGNGNVCGKFQTDQLLHFSGFQHFILKLSRFSHDHFAKAGICFAVISFLMTVSGCKKKTDSTLALNKTKADSSECKKTDNYTLKMGEMIPVREDTAQISSIKKKNTIKKATVVAPPVNPPVLPPTPPTLGVPVAISSDD